MTGKYTPLENHLRDLPATQKEVTLSFDQIEGILKSKLPFSAYESQLWWEHEKEGNHVNARSWANAGWRVDMVDLNRKWVKLARLG
jgi:hypothetical protein